VTTLTPTGKKFVKLVENYLNAKRGRNIKREQAAYDKIRKSCQKHGIDESDIIEQCTKYLKANKISVTGAW
jgi:hypothetical protein